MPARRAQTAVKTVRVKKHPCLPVAETTTATTTAVRGEDWSSMAGDFFTVESARATIYEGENIDAVYVDEKGNQHLLFHLRAHALGANNVDNSWDALLKMARTSQNNNRGTAAGKIDLDQLKAHRPKFKASHVTKFRAYGSKPDGTPSNTHIGNFAHSSVVGWTDSRLRGDTVPCRLTKFSATEAEKYSTLFPLLHEIDDLFKALEPERHQKQLSRAQETVANIDKTAFSTVTVNYDFRTALHQDAGDFREGFGVLLAVNKPIDPAQGCELLLPEFRIGVRLRSRDILFFDTHQWHCNAPLTTEPNVHRLSLVCYLRENLLHKCPRTSQQQKEEEEEEEEEEKEEEEEEEVQAKKRRRAR